MVRFVKMTFSSGLSNVFFKSYISKLALHRGEGQSDNASRQVGILEGSDANLHPKLSRIALIYTTE